MYVYMYVYVYKKHKHYKVNKFLKLAQSQYLSNVCLKHHQPLEPQIKININVDTNTIWKTKMGGSPIRQGEAMIRPKKTTEMNSNIAISH